MANKLLVLLFLIGLFSLAPFGSKAARCDEQSHQQVDQEEPPNRAIRQKWYWDQLPRTCGRHRLNDFARIAEGSNTTMGQYPSFVKVHLGEPSYVFCGGTIISPRHILTAAHCVVEASQQNQRIEINAHTYHPEWPTGRYFSSKICVADNYVNTPASANSTRPLAINDVAIIKLEEPIQFSKIVQPACLPSRPYNLSLSASCPLEFVGLGAYFSTRRSKATSTKGCDKDAVRIIKLPKLPLMLKIKYAPCAARNMHPSISCFRPFNNKGTYCPNDSGSTAYGLENGRQTVQFIASFTSIPCNSGQALPGEMSMANVWELRDTIKFLLQKCA